MPLDPTICSLKNENLWFPEYSYIVYSKGNKEFLNAAIILMSELELQVYMHND